MSFVFIDVQTDSHEIISHNRQEKNTYIYTLKNIASFISPPFLLLFRSIKNEIHLPIPMQHSDGNHIRTIKSSKDEEKFLESFYKTVAFRKKNLNHLQHVEHNAQKRLSDSLLIHHQHIALNRRRSYNSPRLSTIHQHSSLNSQKIFVVRHGERVDSRFGANWLDKVFDPMTGVYHRLDMHLPKQMIKRKDYKDFLIDPPLTEFGLHECKQLGEQLAAQGIQIDHIYASPALRCIQTADKILEGLNKRDKIPIRIEPCLFEFLKWYPFIPVKWPFLDYNELAENGFHIDRSYKPFCPIESLRKDENELMFYSRSHLTTTSILKSHQKTQGNILMVGHVRENYNGSCHFLLSLFSGSNNRSFNSTINRWSTTNS